MHQTEGTLQAQLAILYDERAPGEAKLAAAETLVEAGVAAIPLLVERLGRPENPLFASAMKVPVGPLHAGPPAVLPVHVKFQLESMLYQIIAPRDLPPEQAGAGHDGPARAKAISAGPLERARPPLAYVPDWAAWWKVHRGKSLDELRRWSAGEVSRLWTQIAADTSPPPR